MAKLHFTDEFKQDAVVQTFERGYSECKDPRPKVSYQLQVTELAFNFVPILGFFEGKNFYLRWKGS